ncbi:MAG: thiamine phosphate synthase [Sulfurimicrobium sp.]|nr:thiamine phosphate synthase [Sulfurimicrobium sp.]MDP1704322.1 thiamine phosphate synthase [Sulfurimicrobium sp.]MDP2197538.1 thiamine phosphate synthase [Sulfurimicrobium sp.]MDP3686332.1 thiamine phosphate synthase [Sulfurimicrobium sp.]MDZ7655690.1 thiamine phosphate synthase [Sulfurimicrobium sp.]
MRISGLYAITPEQPDTARLLSQVRAALGGGAQVVQYRSKSQDVALLHEQASELLALCHAFEVPLIINDTLRLADLCGADGLHLGREDGSLRQARVVLGAEKAIGVSCYNSLELAVQAEAEGADYVAFGSFFPSSTKPGAVAAPLSLLSEAKGRLSVPIVAIGGITIDNAASLIAAGADAIAVISGLFDAPDIHFAAQQYSQLFGRIPMPGHGPH